MFGRVSPRRLASASENQLSVPTGLFSSHPQKQALPLACVLSLLNLVFSSQNADSQVDGSRQP